MVIEKIDEQRNALLGLLFRLTQIPLNSIYTLFDQIIHMLNSDSYLKNPDEEIRYMTCLIMSWTQDNILDLKQIAIMAILECFIDKSPRIQKFLANVWDNEDKLQYDPLDRLTGIFNHLYFQVAG